MYIYMESSSLPACFLTRGTIRGIGLCCFRRAATEKAEEPVEIEDEIEDMEEVEEDKDRRLGTRGRLEGDAGGEEAGREREGEEGEGEEGKAATKLMREGEG